MKVLAVCGFGCGSSMILKMTLDRAIRTIGAVCETEVADLATASGIPCDAIFTSAELAEELRRTARVPVYSVQKYMDINEVKGIFEQFLAERA